MRHTRALAAAGLALAAGIAGTAAATAVPASADAPKGAYWRVESIRTSVHPRPVGSGYHLTQRNVSTHWSSPDGKGWNGYRDLGARPATAKDDAAWRADGSPTSWAYRTEGMKIRLSTAPGKGTLVAEKRPPGFRLGDEKYVSPRQLQSLPADAEGLRAYLTADVDAWIDKAAREATTTDPKARKQDWLDHRDRYVAEEAVTLLYAVPAPDKVRAAAYQVLRTTKGVDDLGDAKDPLGRSGRKLALPVRAGKGAVLRQQYVVDTTAMTVLAEYTDLKDGGKPVLGKTGVTTITAAWTDDRLAAPRVP
ncbi:hypothetical protein ACIBK9_34875 [Nonomuraea sp. NPDC050227]|uniref:hypothetical protein n=1 Tax=Nonomuraea sp. NPDC050227 TaxID=3364360 RepID=UPI0037A0709E